MALLNKKHQLEIRDKNKEKWDKNKLNRDIKVSVFNNFSAEKEIKKNKKPGTTKALKIGIA